MLQKLHARLRVLVAIKGSEFRVWSLGQCRRYPCKSKQGLMVGLIYFSYGTSNKAHYRYFVAALSGVTALRH